MPESVSLSVPILLAMAAALASAGAAAGWALARLQRWWSRDEEAVKEDFASVYAEGIAHHLAGRRDEAIQTLIRAAHMRTDVVGLYLILGDLYRAKGLFDRAIRVHGGLLRRQEITRAERAQAHAGLGEDYGTAGIVERARAEFEKALEMDPRSLPALRALSRLRVEERRWEEALALEERILDLDPARSRRPLAFLHNEIGRECLRADDDRGAQRSFQRAVAVDDRTYPAHIFLGDIYYKEGRLDRAVEQWEHVVDLEPRHLHLVYDRLDNAYGEMDLDPSLEQTCRRVVQRDPADWRARVLLARLETERGDDDAARALLMEAARIQPHSITVQQELWRMLLADRIDRRGVQEYLDLVRGVNEFADPFACSVCRHRSLEYLWRCPQCFEWDTFTEENAGARP